MTTAEAPPPGQAAETDAGGLERYRSKRDFRKTAEPAPGEVKQAAPGFSFVVQKHAARRLHYDFRLELDGVLKSWAVTKGPSLDPADKRLAVHVEDHPLEYGGFEGIIPRGEYGGGTVMIWDRGRWEPEGDPHRGYEEGKLSFRLFGKRLKGRWTLVRMGGRAAREGPNENWLLIKSADAAARPGEGDRLVEIDARSVLSRRTMRQIAQAADRVWQSNKADDPPPGQASAKKAAPPEWPYGPATLGSAAADMPEFVAPALASLASKPPAGDRWCHEIKFDGYRMQCRIEDGSTALRTRTGLDWTDRFRRIADAATRLPAGRAMLDGEVVALLPSGASSFSRLQEALKNGQADDIVYFVFDLLFLDGRDLRGESLERRKAMLRALIGEEESVIRYSDHQVSNGPPLFESACRMGLEGIVSKRLAAPYPLGRTRDWLKSKCVERQEFVIGGFTKPTTRTRGVGALLVGYYDGGRATQGGEQGLVYVGRVGTGFTEATSRELRDRLDPLRAEGPPFAQIAPAEWRDAIWVEPRVVCEVDYRGWTSDRRLRHASFQGVREDKPAETVRLEAAADPSRDEPAHTAADAALDEARLTHPDRVLYPEQGLTKRGLAEYYAQVARWMLPHVANRPLSLVRCPSGHHKECFYQKHIGNGLPDGLREVMIAESKGEEPYAVLDDLSGLLALVQMSVLEIHPWGSRADDVEHPDRIIFDLDPDPAVPWARVVSAGFEMRERLMALGLVSFVKTTGGKGLHVVAPVIPRAEWPEVKAFCEEVAKAAVRDSPDRYTANMAKAARTGKIFIDYLRNGRGATAVAAYSPRARAGTPVATPLAWEELSEAITSDHFTVESVPRRLDALESDPWEGMVDVQQALPDRVAGTRPRRRSK